MRIFRWVKSWVTMERGRCLFTDNIAGKQVFEYTDCYGKKWMANFNRWGFRVEKAS